MHVVVIPRWSMVAAAGACAIGFALLGLLPTFQDLPALVALFGAYAFVEGLLLLLQARAQLRGPHIARAWAVEGSAGVLVGLAGLSYAEVRPIAMLCAVAVWAVVKGAAALSALMLVENRAPADFWLGGNAVLSVGFGLVLLAQPGPGALGAGMWLPAYAVLSGAAQIAHALAARRPDREWRPVAVLRLPVRAWHRRARFLVRRFVRAAHIAFDLGLRAWRPRA